MKKKILSTLLAVCILVTFITPTVWAKVDLINPDVNYADCEIFEITPGDGGSLDITVNSTDKYNVVSAFSFMPNMPLSVATATASIIYVTMIPDPGYEVDKIKVSDVEQTYTSNSFEIPPRPDGNKKTTIYVTFKKPVTSITLNHANLNVSIGEPVQLTATVLPFDATYHSNITWSSSDESVATVNQSGLITGVVPGKATITATVDGKSATSEVTVTNKNHRTVTFETNGGSSISSLSAIERGSKITAPTNPTKEGFTFGGWFKDTGLTQAWDFANDTVMNNTTLYAKWIPVSSGGGSSGGSGSTPQSTFVNDTNTTGTMVEIPTGVTNLSKPTLKVAVMDKSFDISKKFISVASEYELQTIFDIDLYNSSVLVTKVEGGKVKLNLPFKERKDSVKYYVLCYNTDNTVTELPCEFKDGMITFETDRLSIHAIATESGKLAQTVEETITTSTNPQTGDSNPLLTIAFALIAIACALFTIIVIRKSKPKNK